MNWLRYIHWITTVEMDLREWGFVILISGRFNWSLDIQFLCFKLKFTLTEVFNPANPGIEEEEE